MKVFLSTPDEIPQNQDSDKSQSKAKNFPFIHQELWQQRLLERYGNDLVLMDGTYKITKYAIPLFFVCVHTNIGYKVVAEFICQTKEKESISKALGIIKSWNPNWNPKFFMVDYSTAEIGATDQQFPHRPFTKTKSLRITRRKLEYRVLRTGRIYSNKSKHQMLSTPTTERRR